MGEALVAGVVTGMDDTSAIEKFTLTQFTQNILQTRIFIQFYDFLHLLHYCTNMPKQYFVILIEKKDLDCQNL